ncbi:HEAT repeat domain-containing protein [Microbispora sp. NPDC049125]|uniref:HEAT repeat domain-containing protein n=1 Tax=Microbispora sp. NPDC049125 TaxID=3154929 RepID=UPI00346675B8
MANDPFAGLSDVRWSRMRHAYGAATEVPELLRGLADPDPAVRETALDGMYGAVHHQGDVYPCTLAAIPFLLRIAGAPHLPGRAEVVELLASIASAEDPAELSGPYKKANGAVTAAYPLWERLLDDPDPKLRKAVTGLLAACVDRARAVTTTLTGRLRNEDDPSVREAVVRTVGALARCESGAEDARDWLGRVLAMEVEPQVKLVALAELASLGDGPAVEVGDALDLLTTLYETGTPPVAPPAAFETPTLIGALRREREASDVGRRAPQAGEIVRTLSKGLGDRVDDRVRLLTALLRSPDGECRVDAMGPAHVLLANWRGDYAGLVSAVGDCVRDGRGRGRPGAVAMSRAAGVLEDLDELAAPAADALAEVLAATERRAASHTMLEDTELPWVIEWPGDQPTVSPALQAFSGTRDARALPMLAWALERERMPSDVAQLVGGFGPRAAPLLPLLRRRLRDLPTADPRDLRHESIAWALSRIGPGAAEALPDLLDQPVTTGLLAAFAAIGPEASACAPILRDAAASPDRAMAIPAAKALWLVTADVGAALAVADRYLGGDDKYALRPAVDILADLAPALTERDRAARARLTLLRRLVRRKDPHGWVPLAAARALYRLTGDPEVPLTVVPQVWELNRHTRTEAAELCAELGRAAAGTRPLLEAELSRVRRHNASDDGYGSAQIVDDEKLLRRCREALEAVG